MVNALKVPQNAENGVHPTGLFLTCQQCSQRCPRSIQPPTSRHFINSYDLCLEYIHHIHFILFYPYFSFLLTYIALKPKGTIYKDLNCFTMFFRIFFPFHKPTIRLLTRSTSQHYLNTFQQHIFWYSPPQIVNPVTTLCFNTQNPPPTPGNSEV